jgi:uncharacterized RDD family membrane protein YckC
VSDPYSPQPPIQPPQPPVQTGYQPSGPSGPRASFGRRLVAYLLDAIIVGVIVVILVVALRGVGYGIGIVVSALYFAYFEGSSSGQTVGKRVFGIRVIDFASGGPIGFGRGLLRWVGRILSQIVCYLGYLWMLWDKEKQCWQDKIANTVVVPVQYYPVAHWP